jgi:hypothetical protein
MCRSGIIGALLAILIPLLLWAGADILEFTAESQGESVLLQWRTGIEVNVAMFEVQRSASGTNFYTVGEVEPNGSYSEYQYVDTNMPKDSTRRYYYRIKIVDTNGAVSYSEVREVLLIFSGIQHTWGSIKAMFR